MKSTRNTSVRRLSSGSYIVSGVSSRSAVTGRFKSGGTGKIANKAAGTGTTKAPDSPQK